MSEIQFESRGAEVACPIGCGELSFGSIAGVKVVGCPSCQGTLVQGEALAQLVTHLRAEYTAPEIMPQAIDPSEDHPRRHCPACWEWMEVHPYYGPGAVVIDSCAACGLVWLDSAELARIERAPGRR